MYLSGTPDLRCMYGPSVGYHAGVVAGVRLLRSKGDGETFAFGLHYVLVTHWQYSIATQLIVSLPRLEDRWELLMNMSQTS